MFDFSNFSMADMTKCGKALRQLGRESASMEEVSQKIVAFFFQEFGESGTDRKACVLVRFFKTHNYGDLEPPLQAMAKNMLKPEFPFPMMKCLTLFGTVGARSEWAQRQQSSGHQAIPLPSAEAVSHIPMVAQLVKQLGMDINLVVSPGLLTFVDQAEQTFNVFYVDNALGSPYIPAQEEFVKPYGVHSVLGFGGLLPSGNLFAVLLFTRVSIPRVTAELFKSLALNIKLALLPFDDGPTFLGEPGVKGATVYER